LSGLDRLACWITNRVGTMGFFLIVLIWTVVWLGWNLLARGDLHFDPPMAFVFWLFISNLIQLLLMPLIMVGQNVQGRHSEMWADHDLEVNVKAEEEIEVSCSTLNIRTQFSSPWWENLASVFWQTRGASNSAGQAAACEVDIGRHAGGGFRSAPESQRRILFPLASCSRIGIVTHRTAAPGRRCRRAR
jgi:hypothetical protein